MEDGKEAGWLWLPLTGVRAEDSEIGSGYLVRGIQRVGDAKG
jgi:hypothetical protein